MGVDRADAPSLVGMAEPRTGEFDEGEDINHALICGLRWAQAA